MLVRNSSNIRKRSIRLLIGLVVVFEFRAWTQDVSQTYVQSSSKLMREVYVRPKAGFSLKTHELLSLLKPLYGLIDSKDYWHATITTHLKNVFNTTPLTGDLACFSHIICNRTVTNTKEK